MSAYSPEQLNTLVKTLAASIGFSAVGVTQASSDDQLPFLQHFVAQGYHGNMDFLAAHWPLRQDAKQLVEQGKSIIVARLDYVADTNHATQLNTHANIGVIARYAQGRDYHKVMRNKLKQLALQLQAHVGHFNFRPFSDSAPIFEKHLAEQAGLGWTGKHTLLINEQAGSYFFLGELITSLDIAPDTPQATQHCGTCTHCMTICPTQAIIAPYTLDARKCIAYLTIEHKGSIEESLRKAIGNRVFGCDDCQVFCPWNKFAKATAIADFQPRHQLNDSELVHLWQWDEATFERKTEGSPIRRTGYSGFMRNVAIALGNALCADITADQKEQIRHALQQKLGHISPLVDEHIVWALQQQTPCTFIHETP